MPNTKYDLNCITFYLDLFQCPVGTVVCGVASAGYWEVTDNVALVKLRFYCCEGAPVPESF